MGKTVPGTRSYHHYTPISTTEISYKRTSEHEFEQHFNLSKAVQVINDDAPLPNLNDFVACRYDTFWWVGIVDEIEAEKKDFKIKFMHPHGPSKRFSWPERDDSCWVPINNMIAVIGVPTTRSGRIYEIDMDDFNKVQRINANRTPTIVSVSKSHPQPKFVIVAPKISSGNSISTMGSSTPTNTTLSTTSGSTFVKLVTSAQNNVKVNTTSTPTTKVVMMSGQPGSITNQQIGVRSLIPELMEPKILVKEEEP
ncbi:hypothetical protein GQR58_001068 [Nymphon striatum]|nr:hypothetical protein GQR58_001068 [Nymphon striatum]